MFVSVMLKLIIRDPTLGLEDGANFSGPGPKHPSSKRGTVFQNSNSRIPAEASVSGRSGLCMARYLFGLGRHLQAKLNAVKPYPLACHSSLDRVINLARRVIAVVFRNGKTSSRLTV
jgi:hypothetical protein